MQNYKNRKTKRKHFWYGWRYDAAEHFNIARSTVDKYYNDGKLELFEWLEKELEERKRKKEKALEIKKNIEENLL